MSKQLTLSASLSVLAMLAFALTGAPALAGDLGSSSSLLAGVAAACLPDSVGSVLPVLR
jgi:hypothetical protein